MKEQNNRLAAQSFYKVWSIVVLTGVALAVLLVLPELARADAWWGEGYRSPEWVKVNGGTIIYYSIKGKKSSDKYKARMYKGGQRIEIEYGSSGVFDDAKSGAYSISAHEGSKKIGTVNFSACPGGTMRAYFDAGKKTASISGCRKRTPKKVKKAPATLQKIGQKTNKTVQARANISTAKIEKESLIEGKNQIKKEAENSGEETKNSSRSDRKIPTVSWNDLFHSFFLELFGFDFLSGKK